MILGNKCDMNDKRQVSKERGEKVQLLIPDITFYSCLLKKAKYSRHSVLLCGDPNFSVFDIIPISVL